MKPLGVVAILIILAGLFFIVMATPSLSKSLPNIQNPENPQLPDNEAGGSEVSPTEDMPPGGGFPPGYYLLYVRQDTSGNLHYFIEPNTAPDMVGVGELIVPAGSSPDDNKGSIMYYVGYNADNLPYSSGGSSSDITRPREGSGTPLSIFGFDITISLTMGLILVLAGIILFLLFGM